MRQFLTVSVVLILLFGGIYLPAWATTQAPMPMPVMQQANPADAQCSYNGTFDTDSSSCLCDAGWFGESCSQLNLGEAQPDGGYRPVQTDAWGAAILYDDETALYHMWVSEIANHCDIQFWARNSKTVHATSTTPEGPYTFESVAFPVMSHEVDVKRGPNGEWVAFITAGLTPDGQLGLSEYGDACTCDPITQEPIDDTCETGASSEATVMLIADSPYGPWSEPIVLLEPRTLLDGIDANFSATINEDGSLVGLWRTYPLGSQAHWVTATDYLDPDSYVFQEQETPLFDAPYDGFTVEGLEDMFVWRDDARGIYHALFHDMVVPDGEDFFDALSHAYSLDGVEWVYTGVAADTTVRFTDGTTVYSARARPHLIIRDGQITHLISAEQNTDDGYDFTLIEPIILE